MTDDDPDRQGLRDRLSRQGEEALGKLAQDLLENPLVSGAVSRAFDAREKASAAQEVAFGALNLPSAGDLERLTRRVRAVSQRLEGLEDGVDRLDERMAALASTGRLEQRLTAIEEHLGALAAELGALREAMPEGTDSVPPAQEGLEGASPKAAGSGGRRRKTSGSGDRKRKTSGPGDRRRKTSGSGDRKRKAS